MYNVTTGLNAKNNTVLESSMKTIKSLRRPHFEIRLVETPSGAYRICYEKNEEVTMGEPLNDYALASRLFDLKLIELEGN